MQCGARCFLIKIEENGQIKEKNVIARTPAKARRFIRTKKGSDVDIISVIAQRR